MVTKLNVQLLVKAVLCWLHNVTSQHRVHVICLLFGGDGMFREVTGLVTHTALLLPIPGIYTQVKFVDLLIRS